MADLHGQAECAQCRKAFEIKKHSQRFCSQKCRLAWHNDFTKRARAHEREHEKGQVST